MNWSTKELADHYRRQGSENPIADACGAKPNKFHARKKSVDGITFDSCREANRYQVLKALQSVGDIALLELQPEYILQPDVVLANGRKQRQIVYRADFRYYDRKTKKFVTEDAKGYRTPIYRLKLKLFRAQYPQVDFREV